MNKISLLNIFSKGYIILSALSLLSVSIMAFNDPQAVMNLVNIKLNNTDAYSSIRGVYGGVGFTLCVFLMYSLRKYTSFALSFLAVLWSSYALSRTITIFAEGPLGDFGTQWLIAESILSVIAFLLFGLNVSARSKTNSATANW